MRKADEISLEELYQILHVSKRKATWMLEHGIIPCRKRDTATHKYAIKLEDVLEYLKKDKIERDKDIPVGIFSSKSPCRKRSNEIILSPEEKISLQAFIEIEWFSLPDVLTVKQASEATGYCQPTIYRLIRTQPIYSAVVGTKTVVSKKSLIKYFSSDSATLTFPKSDWHKTMLTNFREDSNSAAAKQALADEEGSTDKT